MIYLPMFIMSKEIQDYTPDLQYVFSSLKNPFPPIYLSKVFTEKPIKFYSGKGGSDGGLITIDELGSREIQHLRTRFLIRPNPFFEDIEDRLINFPNQPQLLNSAYERLNGMDSGGLDYAYIGNPKTFSEKMDILLVCNHQKTQVYYTHLQTYYYILHDLIEQIENLTDQERQVLLDKKLIMRVESLDRLIVEM